MKLSEKKLQELKDGKIQFDDLNNKFFIDSNYDSAEAENILDLLNSNVCDFAQLVDRYKNTDELEVLLKSEDFFESLIKSDLLNQDDLNYLLSKIDIRYELRNLCSNAPLIKHLLNEFLLNKEVLDKFNIMFEKLGCLQEWHKEHNVHTVFDYIEYEATHKYYDEKDEELIDKKVLSLIKTNNYVRSFNEEQIQELFELLKNNEVAVTRLVQIVETHLENNFSFDSLAQYLKKPERRNLLNV